MASLGNMTISRWYHSILTSTAVCVTAGWLRPGTTTATTSAYTIRRRVVTTPFSTAPFCSTSTRPSTRSPCLPRSPTWPATISCKISQTTLKCLTFSYYSRWVLYLYSHCFLLDKVLDSYLLSIIYSTKKRNDNQLSLVSSYEKQILRKATFTPDARPTPAHSRPIFMAWSGMIG